MHTIVFISVEISRPLTGMEDSTVVYEMISSSALNEAYHDGKWHMHVSLNEYNKIIIEVKK